MSTARADTVMELAEFVMGSSWYQEGVQPQVTSQDCGKKQANLPQLHNPLVAGAVGLGATSTG
jgi:hypothetical protein